MDQFDNMLLMYFQEQKCHDESLIKLLLVVVQESQACNVVAGCCSRESGL